MASEGTILTWDVANWVTVILMAGVGFALLGFGIKAYQKRKGAQAQS